MKINDKFIILFDIFSFRIMTISKSASFNIFQKIISKNYVYNWKYLKKKIKNLISKNL